jgi:hypothetical protein
MLKKLFAFFRNIETKKESNLKEQKSTYYHEDLFRQVEFIPRENINLIEIENNKISEFSKRVDPINMGFKIQPLAMLQ